MRWRDGIDADSCHCHGLHAAFCLVYDNLEPRVCAGRVPSTAVGECERGPTFPFHRVIRCYSAPQLVISDRAYKQKTRPTRTSVAQQCVRQGPASAAVDCSLWMPLIVMVAEEIHATKITDVCSQRREGKNLMTIENDFSWRRVAAVLRSL